MPSPLAHTPNLLWNYLRRGDRGVDEVADRLHEAAHDQPNGKFDKRSALYLPQSPFPPLLWRNQCGRCRFWQEGAPGEPGQCHIVGRPDDDFGGEAIHQRGWCALFTPPAGEPPFAWLDERLHPDGASSVRGRYDPSARAERRREGATATGRGEDSTADGHTIPVTEADDDE